MKFNKELAIILVLLSMLISAIAVSIYFYKQNQKTMQKNRQLVTIYIAKKNIKKDTKIKKEHLKKSKIARKYIITKVLLSKEIIGKYAIENIYKNESFIKEKLSNKILDKKERILDYKYNIYNISLENFKNPNYSLEPDDIVNIISVYKNSSNKTSNDYNVNYVAKNVRVLGFMKDGHLSKKSIERKKIKKTVKKRKIEEIVNLKADEIVLDMKKEIILALIKDLNKGKQLWFVKSREEKIENNQKKFIKEQKKKVVKKRIIKKKPKPKNYPLIWYKPKNSVHTKTVTISYEDNKELNQTKKIKIQSKEAKECLKTDKLLIVVKNSTTLRTNPSRRAKQHINLNKNYIIPYIGISKINNSWYRLCDSSYVNGKDVRLINYEEYKNLKR